ncbi:MAG: cobalt ABC transporter permease, partial [Lacticaseibacillus rhamnosus]
GYTEGAARTVHQTICSSWRGLIAMVGGFVLLNLIAR